jgi:hypothetical protein
MVNTDNYKMELLITAPSRILGLPAKNGGKDWTSSARATCCNCGET